MSGHPKRNGGRHEKKNKDTGSVWTEESVDNVYDSNKSRVSGTRTREDDIRYVY